MILTTLADWDIDEDVHLPPQKPVKKTEKAKKTVRDRKSRLQRW